MLSLIEMGARPTRSSSSMWLVPMAVLLVLSATGIDAWVLDNHPQGAGSRADATKSLYSRWRIHHLDASPSSSTLGGECQNDNSRPKTPSTAASRRAVLQRTATAVAAAATVAAVTTTTTVPVPPASAASTVEGPGNVPKFVQEYSDFVESPLGFSYRNVPSPTSSTSSAVATRGDRVVFDWSGYTIGYFGRPFQAKGGPQGGAFDKDLDYARTVLGSHEMVEGLELALEGMKAGEVRQVIVPYGKLSYPEDDPGHDRVGPKPSTFSGERALDFVLQNPRLDRTLLFNVKVIRVDKPNGKGGFVRG